MAKRFTKSAEQIQPDPRYRSRGISKFINCLMHDGKKSVAVRVFYRAMDRIAARVKDAPPNLVFERAVENVRPRVEVRSRRVGGATYQVPKEVPPKRQQMLAFRWILHAARSRKGKPMADCLADEILAAYRGEGVAVTQRENVHKMAEANKAFSHFAW